MKISPVFLIILFVICFGFGGRLWYQLDYVEGQLNNTKVQLDSVTVQLGEAKNKVSVVKHELKRTVNALDATKNQLQIIEDDNALMLGQYASFKREIEYRAGVIKQDCQGFITPNNNLVSEKAREITGGYSEDTNERWRDYYRLYEWVVNNIHYSYDSNIPLLPESLTGELIWHKSYWRLPEETLIDKTGDCEDMAVLLVSLMRSYNQEKYTIWGIRISSGVPDASSHIGVALPVEGGRLTIVDPAGNYYTGSGSLSSESFSVAVNKWSVHLESKIPEGFISGVFTDDFYYEFNNTAEFLTWIEGR